MNVWKLLILLLVYGGSLLGCLVNVLYATLNTTSPAQLHPNQNAFLYAEPTDHRFIVESSLISSEVAVLMN